MPPGNITQRIVEWGPGEGYGDALSTLEALAPALERTTSALFDPRQRLANLEAKLIAARARGASLQTIQTYEAKIAAIRLQITREDESLTSTRQTRFWAQLGLGSIALVAIASAFFIFTRAFRT